MPGTEHVEITGPNGDRYDEILTPQAIDLIAALHAELGPRRSELLTARRRRQPRERAERTERSEEQGETAAEA